MRSEKLTHQPLVILSAILLGLLFYFYPDLDIRFTSLFYNGSFFLDFNPIVKILHKSVPIISVIFVIVAAFLGLKTLWHKRSIKPKHYLKIIYVTLVCLIGPGAIVHYAIKDNFGRARPNETVLFGGEKQFTAAFQVSDQCSSNCSFVSGHASVGFMFYALAFLLKGRNRNIMIGVATTLGLIIGCARVMEGDHFLSDVIFAGFVVYFTAYYLEKLIKPNSK